MESIFIGPVQFSAVKPKDTASLTAECTAVFNRLSPHTPMLEMHPRLFEIIASETHGALTGYCVQTGEDYWISGPKRRGGDALY